MFCENRWQIASTMPGYSCVVCGNTSAKDKNASLHRFPSVPEKRSRWLEAFQISEDLIRSHSRVCCRHFRDGDATKEPIVSLGKRFASPIKMKTSRAKRAKIRNSTRELQKMRSSLSPPFPCSSTKSPTPPSTPHTSPLQSPTPHTSPPQSPTPHTSLPQSHTPHTSLPQSPADESSLQSSTPFSSLALSVSSPQQVTIDELLETVSQLHHIPPSDALQSQTEVLASTALLARIEALETENNRLRATPKPVHHFRIVDIKDDDCLVHFYTGFKSFVILMAFFEYLGPVVHELNYWGAKQKSALHQRHRSQKIDPLNQFFLLMIKTSTQLEIERSCISLWYFY